MSVHARRPEFFVPLPSSGNIGHFEFSIFNALVSRALQQSARESRVHIHTYVRTHRAQALQMDAYARPMIYVRAGKRVSAAARFPRQGAYIASEEVYVYVRLYAYARVDGCGCARCLNLACLFPLRCGGDSRPRG